MSLTTDDVKKIAHLARLSFNDQEVDVLTQQLSGILDFVEQMNKANTQGIEPVAHSIDLSQRLRPDVVTEHDQRAEFQKIAPEVEVGLYLVPQVIEGGE